MIHEPWSSNFLRDIDPHHNFVSSSLARYPEAEEKICKEFIHFQYSIIGYQLGGYKFHNSSSELNAYYNHSSSLIAYVPKQRIFFFKFAFSTVVLAPPHQAPGRQGSWIFTICTPFIDKCYMPAVVEIGSVIQEKELKMYKSYDRRTIYDFRRMNTDKNRQQ